MRQRHVILSAFVNLAGGALLIRPNSEPEPVAMRQRVTPPGLFESPDPDQIARLIRARCLKAADTAVGAVPGAVVPQEGTGVSPADPGEAVLHSFQNPDAPSPIPPAEANSPEVVGGTVQHTDTAAHTGPAPGPIAGAGSAITVGDQDSGVSPQAGAGVSPPVITPPVSAVAPPQAAATGAKSKGGANPANVAGANSGGSGDGTLSNRERRRLAREQASKRD